MKKQFVYYETERNCLNYSIVILLAFPILAFLQVLIKQDGNVQQTLQETAKLCLIVLPVAILLMACYAFFRSEMVEFRDDAIYIYRFITSKKAKKLSYNEITECVVSNGLWTPSDYHGGYRRRIFLLNRGASLKKIEMSDKMIVELYLKLGDERFKVLDSDANFKTVSEYFDIDFSGLSYEQKLVLAKGYCHLTKRYEGKGRYLLEKKHLL